MVKTFHLTLRAPNVGQDNFFLWSMIILPIVADGSYIFDAWYDIAFDSDVYNYQGLLSTILIVFTYLRYCSPIESPKMLLGFYILLCILSEIGTIGYLVLYIRRKDTFNIVIFIGWAILELIMTGCLIYYRVIKHCHPSFHVESKHLFHFISRLEVILAIFIPFFLHNTSVTLTKHSIAFFLLFDFFSDSYSRFLGFWIKSILYLFVCTVTVCVATEWIFFGEHAHICEIISSLFELISACLCNLLIILQFIPYHLTPLTIAKIARDGLVFQQTNEMELRSIAVIGEPTVARQISGDSIYYLTF